MTSEFDRQFAVLTAKGYPRLAGMGPDDFAAALEAARSALDGLPPAPDEAIPFVLVPARSLVPPDAAAAAIERQGKDLIWMLQPGELASYVPVESVRVPDAPAYLVTAVESVGRTLGSSPEDAVRMLAAEGRSPLTLEEGIALATQFPQAIAPNACFQMPGSRRGDRRVPSLWLSEGRPKLGWCYAGAPHTWLGTASCERRLG